MLKCKINTKKLENALKKLEVIRPTKSDLKILENIKLETSNNKVILTTMDLKNQLEIYITDAYIEHPGTILLSNIKNLMKSFKYFKDAHTTIELHSDKIIIFNGQKSINMKPLDITEYPKNINPGVMEIKYKYNTKDLYNRIKKVEYATHKDELRPILQGIHFNSFDMVAIDGYRMAISRDSDLNINNAFTISETNYKSLLKLLDKKNKKDLIISHNNNYICFEFDNMILTSQLLEGKYYNYNQIIPTSYNTLVTVDKIQLQENIKFLGLYSKDVKDLTKWNITKDNLEITVNTTEGIYKTNNDITFEGNELLIGLNNSYILDVLKTIEDSRIEIKFKRNTAPVLIETDKEIHLILPVRIIDSQTT